MKTAYAYFIPGLFVLLISCNKLVEIDPPTNTIVTEQAFSNDYNATTSIRGIYSKLINQSKEYSFGNGVVSSLVGISSDETSYFGSDVQFSPFFKNQILPDNRALLPLWQNPYETIYVANACLEQLAGNNNITPSLRDQLIGEAKFIRAYCYFYLINTFGDVPLLTSTSYNENSLTARAQITTIYSEIINDLESSKNVLPDNYAVYDNERTRVTKWAAIALLARIYLYTGDWIKAQSYSDNVISNSDFSLVNDLKSVFLKNSSEAILQLSISGSIQPDYNVLPEAAITIPLNRTRNPRFYLPKTFINEFSPTDARRRFWVDSTIYSGTIYYIPYKYKVGPSQKLANSSPNEYYMVLRLAEQYLIRAEAKARTQDLVGAAADINVIRARAGLDPVTFSSLDDAINKILQERKKEFFYEWGHRWFDLKRTGKLDSVMSIATSQKGGTWKSTANLFPIPASEVFKDHNLTQNPGY